MLATMDQTLLFAVRYQNSGFWKMLSDESEDVGGEESHEMIIYRRKYQMLLERCEILQQDNERLVHRIQEVYKYTRKVRRERKFLMDRLDNYGDNWRQGIAQYIHDDSTLQSRSMSKLKPSVMQNLEKQGRKSVSKKVTKEKNEHEMTGRKHSKDLNKNIQKNISGYNFLP